MTKIQIRFGLPRVGIGGPVGAGKTSLTEALCRTLSQEISMAVMPKLSHLIESTVLKRVVVHTLQSVKTHQLISQL